MGSLPRPLEWGYCKIQFGYYQHAILTFRAWLHRGWALVPPWTQTCSSGPGQSGGHWQATGGLLHSEHNLYHHIMWHVMLKCGLKIACPQADRGKEPEDEASLKICLTEADDWGTFHHPAWVWLPRVHTRGEHNVLPVFHFWKHNVMRKWVTDV